VSESDGLRNMNVKSYEHVDHPPHYNAHPSGVEAIQLCSRFHFAWGTMLKYLFRVGRKPGTAALQDLEKALWYATTKEASSAMVQRYSRESTLEMMQRVRDAEPDSVLGKVLTCMLNAETDVFSYGVIPTLKDAVADIVLEKGRR
jgi:hypothetical protein